MRSTLFAVLVIAQIAWAQSATVHYGPNNSPLNASSPAPPPNAQPVLFVHGHKFALGGADPNDLQNWQQSGNGLAFTAVLEHAPNDRLGIEPYYIRFAGVAANNRSMVDDANEIEDAVDRILKRHDPAYTTGGTTGVRVAIIAYSKGTISTRYYIKHLLPTTFNPISEFVAIAPPNHGLAGNLNIVMRQSQALRQLNNGWDEDGNVFSENQTGDENFIANLNGGALVSTPNPDEAPHSRAEGDPLANGTLYVCLFADGNRDFVGGDVPQSNVNGRKLASNLAPHAVNRTFAVPGGSDTTLVHQNTVHFADVICTAIYTVVHHRPPPAGFACPTDGAVPLIPPRTAVKLVLDVSGSMLGTAGSQTKLAIMQDAVTLFTNLWLETANPADRLGVTYFGSATSAFEIGGDLLVPMDSANAALLLADVNGLDPATVAQNLTAMGPGLLDGIAALQPGHVPSRHVVLLTDGMQNVAPLVATNPPAVGGTALNTDLGIKLHTIEVGGMGPVMALLDAIATSTGGTSAATVDPQADLNQYFVQTLIAALRDHSPQLIAYRRGTVAGDVAVEQFVVNARTRRLVLKLSWPRGKKLSYGVTRDGTEMTKQARVREGAFFRILAFDSPAAGTWRMHIHAIGAASYAAAAIVDEPGFRYGLALKRSVYRAGEPIEATLTLARADATAVATVAVPSQSTGNLLSLVDVGMTQAKDGTPAGRKLQKLVQNETLWSALLPKARSEPLTNNGDNSYSLSFGDTTVPGPYAITVAITAGNVRRSATITALVGIGPVDFEASDVHIDGQVLHLRPRDAHGNFLGPGYAHTIRIEPTPQGDVADQLDGSYTIDLGAGPDDIRIVVGGDLIFEGPAADLKRRSDFPWGWLPLAIILIWLLARRLRR